MCVAAATIYLHNDFVPAHGAFHRALKSSHSVQGFIAFSVCEDSESSLPLLPWKSTQDRWINEQQNVSLLSLGRLLITCDSWRMWLRSEVRTDFSILCWRLPDLSCRWEVITTQPWAPGHRERGRRHPLSHIRLSVSLQTLVNAQCQDPAHGWEVL